MRVPCYSYNWAGEFATLNSTIIIKSRR